MNRRSPCKESDCEADRKGVKTLLSAGAVVALVEVGETLQVALVGEVQVLKCRRRPHVGVIEARRFPLFGPTWLGARGRRPCGRTAEGSPPGRWRLGPAF